MVEQRTLCTLLGETRSEGFEEFVTFAEAAAKNASPEEQIYMLFLRLLTVAAVEGANQVSPKDGETTTHVVNAVAYAAGCVSAHLLMQGFDQKGWKPGSRLLRSEFDRGVRATIQWMEKAMKEDLANG